MKLKIKDRVPQRAIKRFKWMCITGLCVATISYIADQGLQSIQEFSFVEAGDDATFEQDEIYQEYVHSAKLQQELMSKQNQAGHQSWTMDQYNQYQARRLQTAQSVRDALNNGDETWFEQVAESLGGNHDLIPEVLPLGNSKYFFKEYEWENYAIMVESQGYMEEYYDGDQCYSGVISNIGISLLPKPLTGIFYILFLGYLFLGVAISADIFMEAIEVITSKTQVMDVYDEKSETSYQIEVPVWNATMANLTLMAFGSSAPEIILSVLEALKALGEPQAELGPSTIVGSAAFNLLVISAVSVSAVGEEPKKVDDVGVFATTGIFSIFAYVWLYLCLSIVTPGVVTINEAAWTFAFFFILLSLAFCADKYNQRKKAKVDNEQSEKENLRKMKKSHLRSIARQKGEVAVLGAAQGQKNDSLTDQDVQSIKDLYMEILETNDLSKIPLDALMGLLKPDSLFERFAARKANQVGATKDFLEIKGQKFQMENTPTTPIKQESELVAFKCLHYSVTESAGTMTVTVIKKNMNTECTFGLKTKEATAKAGKDFDQLDDVFTMKKREQEMPIEITIHDNQDWQPDMDFFIEIYDTKNGQRVFGDDTECRITILDEDFPGKLGFEMTEIEASRTQDKVDIVVKRFEGTDGKISCMIRTEPLIPDKTNPSNAIEFEDYLPKHEKIEFASGESEKIVPIYLVNERVPQIEGKAKDLGIGESGGGDDDEDDEDDHGPRFKVVIEKPEPEQVKISKKNCCTVELKSKEKDNNAKNEHTKMINYFISQKNPTWDSQFKNAVMLCPKVDEDDLIVSEVEMTEALMHFATIGWKIIFSSIPPCQWGGGWPAFGVALIFIGGITAIVAEVATVLGCTVGLHPAVTAITFVAIGTSLPDTFASMTAAQQSPYADSAIGNVTGSNSVNVFVGLGLPWLISAIYQSNNDAEYLTPPGALAFSVMLFLITSITCFIILIARRCTIGGELGGPPTSKMLSSIVLTCLWLFYVVFSTLKAYEIIEGI